MTTHTHVCDLCGKSVDSRTDFTYVFGIVTYDCCSACAQESRVAVETFVQEKRERGRPTPSPPTTSVFPPAAFAEVTYNGRTVVDANRLWKAVRHRFGL